MTKLESLRNTNSLSDLAVLLGFTPRGLAYTLYKTPDGSKYQKFQIAKKKGGVRDICAPKGALKLLQRNLANLLYDCRDEINKDTPRRPLAHGFRRKQSIFDNAKKHRHRRFVLNLDLKDFFPAFNFGRVRGFFIKNRDFSLNEKVATIIAQIACFENILPQGSPCSPIIADMLAHILDVRLVRLSKAHHVTYSRYADDLTFSTNERSFPAALGFRDAAPGSDWILGYDLIRIIERAGFMVNPVKTRMQVRTGRQVVTGLTVNTKVNIPQEYARSARAMCNSLFGIGTYHRRVPAATSSDGTITYEMIENLNPLEGILSYIYHIKRSMELTRHAKPPASIAVPSQKVYSEFLFYKYFVALSRPIVVCEGRTDNIYLKYAVRHLHDSYPTLGHHTVKGFVLDISFFRYNNTAHNILGLTGGSSTVKKFINTYARKLRRYQHRPLSHPIIILIDNDTALAELKSDLKKYFSIEVELTSTELFYHLINNLFLIKTPEIGTTGSSCIEDCFETALRATQLDGKTFNPEKNLDPATQYGKGPFAEKVIVPDAKDIAWDGFRPLLDRISAVIADYVPPASAALAAAA